jgi:hypothetical protein
MPAFRSRKKSWQAGKSRLSSQRAGVCGNKSLPDSSKRIGWLLFRPVIGKKTGLTETFRPETA